MLKPTLTAIIYKRLYPNPRPGDPTSFSAHISRNLVPEVRIETATFYGLLDCIEAQYPGLDYSHPPHRMRLSRFAHHRRLFRIFDELRLTKVEIASIVRWEGSLWARERYERDNGVKIRDTTAEDIMVQPVPTKPMAVLHVPSSAPISARNRTGSADDSGGQQAPPLLAGAHPGNNPPGDRNDEDADDESEDEMVESVGLALNQRLLAATQALTDNGQPAAMDPDFEQWLKEAAERGSFETVAGITYPMPTNPTLISTSTTVDPIDIVASYASRLSTADTTTTPQPLQSHSTRAIPPESILDAEAGRRQAETAR